MIDNLMRNFKREKAIKIANHQRVLALLEEVVRYENEIEVIVSVE